MIQYGFEQSIAGFDQLQIGDPVFHFRRFGRLRQLLHQGQFVGRIAPRRRLVGAFLPQQGIEQRPGVRRQRREYDFAQAPKGEVECTREYRNESQKGRKAG